jgi:hypothetical protein
MRRRVGGKFVLSQLLSPLSLGRRLDRGLVWAGKGVSFLGNLAERREPSPESLHHTHSTSVLPLTSRRGKERNVFICI